MQDYPQKPPNYRHTDKFIGLILFNSQMVKAGKQKKTHGLTDRWIDTTLSSQKLFGPQRTHVAKHVHWKKLSKC